MKFFNIDMHASVIKDIQTIFSNLGHQVDDWSISGHHWVMGKNKANIVFNDGTKLLGGNVSQETCDKFYDTFKETLDKYDGFICCYPVEFALLYEKWNKPIIVINCVRYEHPNTRAPLIWKRLNKCLKTQSENKNLWYVCNNKGDQFYIKYYTGIDGIWIPSLCDYISHKYTGTINQASLVNPRIRETSFSNRTSETARIKETGFFDRTKSQYIYSDRSYMEGLPNNLVKSLSAIRDDMWRYSWKDLYSYKGIIHVPYHNGSMSIFEQYTANVPLFFPSKKFGKELFHQKKMFDDLTFYYLYNLPEPDDINNPNRLSNPEILNKWFDTCDFYDPENMPYVTYFDSFDHLYSLLESVDTHYISEQMKQYNVTRKNMIYSKWKKILNEIQYSINKNTKK